MQSQNDCCRYSTGGSVLPVEKGENAMKKQWSISIVLAVLAALMLTACSRSNQNSSTPESSSTENVSSQISSITESSSLPSDSSSGGMMSDLEGMASDMMGTVSGLVSDMMPESSSTASVPDISSR